MIRLWGLLFGLAVAVSAGLVVKATFAKASAQFERHIPARSDDVETAARELWGDMASGGNLVRLHNQNSSRLLSSGSEGSL